MKLTSPLAALCLSLTILVAGAQARADLRVDDPKGILGQVDAFLGMPTFENSFQPGDKVIQEWHGCAPVCDANDPNKCTVQCGPAADASTEVVSVSPSDAVTRAQVADQPNSDTTVSRADFESAHGNYLRLYIKTLDDGNPADSISIDSVAPADATMRDGHVVKALKIRLTMHTSAAFPMTLIIGKGVPFVAQAVELNLFPDQTDTPSLKLLSVNRSVQ